MENGAETVQKAWDVLATDATEANSEASPAPEPEQNKPEPAEPPPEDMTNDELRGKLADGLKKDTGDVVLALYECIGEVARTAGIQTRIVLESMYELDTVLSHIGGV